MKNLINKLFLYVSFLLLFLTFGFKKSYCQDNLSSLSKIDFYCRECSYELFDNKIYTKNIKDSKSSNYEIKIYKKSFDINCDIIRKKPSNKSTFKLEGQWITDIGSVTIDNNSTNILIIIGTGGSGASGKVINLINLESMNYIYLSFTQSGQELPSIERSTNFNGLNSESEFIEKLKYELGYFDEESMKSKDISSDKMMEVWKYNNDEINNNKMKINIFNGIPKIEASENAKLETDEMIYTAYFKSGVIAQNKNSNSYFVIFVPKNSYCWVSVIEKYKNYLFLGTRGEGLAVINLNSFVLKRFDLGEKNNSVEKISIVNNRIFINDTKEINFKEF